MLKRVKCAYMIAIAFLLATIQISKSFIEKILYTYKQK